MNIFESLIPTLDETIIRLKNCQLVAQKLKCKVSTLNEIKSQIDLVTGIQYDLNIYTNQIPIQYINNIRGSLVGYKENLPLWETYEIESPIEEMNPFNQNRIEDFFGNDEKEGDSSHPVQELRFLFDFFKRLNYITNNMVIIGANGSGKSSLAATLKSYLGPYSLIISAQKLLLIPTFESISNPESANSTLSQQQSNFNYTKWTYTAGTHASAISHVNDLTNQFKNLIDNLLASRSEALHYYVEGIRTGEIAANNKDNIPETNLDKVINIWNRLFPHRTLLCKHVNIAVKVNDTQEEYQANHMSDGEKVALYYISQILQAPKNSLIIIDEPEMYLHKTILSKLWDTLEKERNDCIYLYLTHDIDFATSRNDAKKYWMKEFKYPHEWDINEIEHTDELPEHLFLELVGSRKNILFCEGEIGKSDDEIYKIIFPNFTVKPVGSCINVIDFTRAFNKINNLTSQAFGLIDADHSPVNRLDKLAEDKIYSLHVAEIENLLLEEDLLRIVVDHSPVELNDAIINKIKNIIISALEEDIENQSARYISAEIDFYFKASHVNEGKSKKEVENNFQKFVAAIDIENKFEQRISKLKEIIHQKNYLEVLRVYNNKGLSTKIHSLLETKSYKKHAIKLIKTNNEARESLKKHFPKILLEKGYNIS